MIDISDSMHNSLKVKCKRVGVPMRDVITLMISRWINENKKS